MRADKVELKGYILDSRILPRVLDAASYARLGG